MELNIQNRNITVAGKKYDIAELAKKLSAKEPKAVVEQLKPLIEGIPRSIRMRALRTVLNEYVMKAKELDFKNASELCHRLTWYPEYSEFQLENFFNQVCALKEGQDVVDLVAAYKENFYFLLLASIDQLPLVDHDILNILEVSEEYVTFAEFNNAFKPLMYDYHREFDGLKYDDFRRVLEASSTLIELREIGDKFEIVIPRRLKKDELVEIILARLKKQGKLDEAVRQKVSGMSILPLQRFAKENGIKASTELKKEEVIEYILSKIDETPTVVQNNKVVDTPYIEELEAFEFKIEYLRDIIEKPVMVPADQLTNTKSLTEDQIQTLIAEKVQEMIRMNMLNKQVGTVELEEEIIEEHPALIEEEPIEEPEEIQADAPEEEIIPEEVIEEEKEEIVEEAPKTVIARKHAVEERVVYDEIPSTIIERAYRQNENLTNEVIAMNHQLLRIIESTNNRIGAIEQQILQNQQPQPVTVVFNKPEKEEVELPQNNITEETPVVAEEKALEPSTIIIRKTEEPKPTLTELAHPKVSINEPIRIDSNAEALSKFDRMKVIASMNNDSVQTVGISEEDNSPVQSRKERKLAKKQERLEKMQLADQKRILSRRRNRIIRRWVFLIVFLLFALVVSYVTIVAGVYRGQLYVIDNTIPGGSIFAFNSDHPLTQFINEMNNAEFVKKYMYDVAVEIYKWVDSSIIQTAISFLKQMGLMK